MFVLDPNQSPTVKTGFRPEQKSVQGFVNNVGKSGMNLIGGLGSAAINVLNPNLQDNTLFNLGKTIYDTGGAIAGDRSKGNKFNQLADFYKTRYGGLENIGNTLYNDPVGAAMDVSAVLGGGGELAKLGGMGDANVFSKAAEMTNPLSIAGKGVGMAKGTMEGILNKGGNTLLNESENILTRGMGNPGKLKDVKGVSPVTMNELFGKYKTYDRTSEAFGNAAKSASETRTGMIANAGGKVDVLNILKDWDNKLKELTIKANEGSQGALEQITELQKRRQIFLDSIGAKSGGFTPLQVDATKVDRIRGNFEGDMPKNAFAAPQSELNKASGIKSAYRGLLGGLEDTTPGIKNVGREISALKKLEEIAKSQESRAATRQNLNFSKLGSAGLGGMLGGIPGAAAGFAAEQIANNPRTLMATSNAMEAGGNLLKNAKLPDVKIPMGAVQAARINSNVSQTQGQKSPAMGGVMPVAKSIPQISPTSQQVTPYTQPTTKYKPLQYAMPKSMGAFGKSTKVKKSNSY